MEGNTLPFQYEEIQACNGFLESMNIFLKDSDAVEEKALIKKFLKKTTNAFQFVILGELGVGKTSLLKALFGEAIAYGEEVSSTIGINEFRYGAEKAEFQVEDGHLRIFRPDDILKGISVIDIQGSIWLKSKDWHEKIVQYMEKSDVLIVVFQADSINILALWDLLESVEARKIVCVLTKADLYTADIVEQNKVKVMRYLTEAGIKAPVFSVSCEGKAENRNKDFGELKDYVNKNIIGENIGLKKQRENILELKKVLSRVSSSFQLRKRQYENDLVILNKINYSMDRFLAESREKIDLLKDGLCREIAAVIDSYENEIIIKLNPGKIKERFPNGYTDFVEYLNFINEGYRKKMTENVDRKTQEAIRAYLSQLEIVFDEAVGYFRSRESVMQLEDHFYGSIAKSKQTIVARLENELQETKVFYGSLTNASEALFLKLWQERGKHDRKNTNAGILGGIAGSAAGAGGVYGIAALFGSVGILWPVVAAIVDGAVIANMAKNIMSARSAEEMEIKVKEAIEEFREEVSETREQITDQIMETIEAIFRREIDMADKAFLEFRKSVNIDGRNIQALETRMGQICIFMQKIEQMEIERISENDRAEATTGSA